MNMAKLIGFCVVGFFGVLLLFGSFYVVPSGEVGVIKHIGVFEDTPASPGAHLKAPFADSVYKENVQMHVVNYSAANKDVNDQEPSIEANGIISEPAISVLDAKNVGYEIDLTVQYTPFASKMPDILTNYGENYFDKALQPVIRAVARDVGGQYAVETIADNRQAFEAKVESGLEEKFKGLPFTFNGVQIRNIDLPDAVKERIIQVQQAQQDKQKLDVQAQQAVVNRTIIDTNAGAAADKLRLEAEGTAAQILAIGRAQAEANRLVSQSLTPLLVENNRIGKWDGSLPQYLMGSSSGMGMLLSVPSLTKKPAAVVQPDAPADDNGGGNDNQ